MDKIARLSPVERRDIFSEAASQLGIRPTIIEKDFWVCLVLKTLFVDSPFANALVFKGGTSLSKVYRVIERFSEDVDLVLDWKLIGYGKDLIDPMQPSIRIRSRTSSTRKSIALQPPTSARPFVQNYATSFKRRDSL